METKLNDNEVREIARMQSVINSYEDFILAIYFMIRSGKRIDYPLFTTCDMEKQMNHIWEFVKEHKEIKE